MFAPSTAGMRTHAAHMQTRPNDVYSTALTFCCAAGLVASIFTVANQLEHNAATRDSYADAVAWRESAGAIMRADRSVPREGVSGPATDSASRSDDTLQAPAIRYAAPGIDTPASSVNASGRLITGPIRRAPEASNAASPAQDVERAAEATSATSTSATSATSITSVTQSPRVYAPVLAMESPRDANLRVAPVNVPSKAGTSALAPHLSPAPVPGQSPAPAPAPAPSAPVPPPVAVRPDSPSFATPAPARMALVAPPTSDPGQFVVPHAAANLVALHHGSDADASRDIDPAVLAKNGKDLGGQTVSFVVGGEISLDANAKTANHLTITRYTALDPRMNRGLLEKWLSLESDDATSGNVRITGVVRPDQAGERVTIDVTDIAAADPAAQ
ncbi:protein of unknown function [Pararobbsia alpina]|uniref:hypothetical protein n=1 Tax=Pararobbsia alpina TaxID=621374 RepID=UPI0039A520E8